MCSDLVTIDWKSRSGTRKLTAVVNLEDISTRGACVQVDRSIPVNAQVTIHYPTGTLVGNTRYCVFRGTGYFVGVQFADGQKWTRRKFEPQHLFDPRRLSPRKSVKAKAAGS